MIQSDEREVLEYDIESQLLAMELIQAGLNGSKDADKLKYFTREYCRTSDIPAVFVELKAKHGVLADAIEAFEV
jgi:hypothetical protein